MKELIKKKKFWLAVIGIAGIASKYYFDYELPVDKIADFLLIIFG